MESNSIAAAIYSAAADTDASPDLDTQILLGTHSLIQARSDAGTTCGITAINDTHNALHVAISDGTEMALVNPSGELLVDIQGVTGTTGLSGPAQCLSIAGTRSGGVLKELLVDSL